MNRPPAPSLFLFVLPALAAAAGMGTARALYPAENAFSVMTCTISFLGSPDANRNPDGWRWYQAGMSAAVWLLALLAWHRLGRRAGRPRWLAALATAAYLSALGLILAATWIPDSRAILWGETSAGAFHTRTAIIAIIVMMAAVVLDGLALAAARARPLHLAHFVLFGAAAATGLASLSAWKRKCQADPGLRSWPGEGIHSTPMWEWILFASLCVFLSCQAAAGRKPA